MYMGFCITQERDSVILSPLIKLPSTQCLSQLSRGFFTRLTMTLPNYITDCAENLMSQRSTQRWTRETPLHGRSSPEKSDCCLFQPLHTQETHPTQKLPHQCLLLGDKVLGRGLVVISIARAVSVPLCPSQQEGSMQGKERKAASSSLEWSLAVCSGSLGCLRITLFSQCSPLSPPCIFLPNPLLAALFSMARMWSLTYSFFYTLCRKKRKGVSHFIYFSLILCIMWNLSF